MTGGNKNHDMDDAWFTHLAIGHDYVVWLNDSFRNVDVSLFAHLYCMSWKYAAMMALLKQKIYIYIYMYVYVYVYGLKWYIKGRQMYKRLPSCLSIYRRYGSDTPATFSSEFYWILRYSWYFRYTPGASSSREHVAQHVGSYKSREDLTWHPHLRRYDIPAFETLSARPPHSSVRQWMVPLPRWQSACLDDWIQSARQWQLLHERGKNSEDVNYTEKPGKQPPVICRWCYVISYYTHIAFR